MAAYVSQTIHRVPKIIATAIKYTPVSIKRPIMTTRLKLDKVLEDLRKNPYFDKYAQKIAKLQETEPEEFLQRVETQENKFKEKEQRKKEQNSYVGQAKPKLDSASQVQKAKLDSVMKMDMVIGKTKEEIMEIWKEYHRNKDYISGTMSGEQYDKMFNRGQKYPTFLLPLPREQGYEFIVVQFSESEIHMTPLLWYQTYKENAPECLTMVHYDDLKADKNIVLMRGEYDEKYMNVQEAQCLANELQLFYCGDSPEKLQLLETFTNRSTEFKHMDLIAQLESISLNVSKNASN